MPVKSVDALLNDISLLGGVQRALVDSVRSLVQHTGTGITEEVKYGGIVFAAQVQFCGVFAYREHVSLEFSHGAKIPDPLGHLEGAGKGRRHIKLRSLPDIDAKNLAYYLPLGLEAAKAAERADFA